MKKEVEVKTTIGEENFKPFPCEAAKEQYYRLVEAIVKGGRNKW